MKNSDKLIALAEFMGWKNIHMEVWDCELGEEPVGVPPEFQLPGRTPTCIPVVRGFTGKDTDYLHSHNAMCEVEKRFTDEQWLNYIKHLVAPQEGMSIYELIREAMQRSPIEKAVAVLKTIGKL